MDLDDTVTLVVGGAGGLGEATVRELAAAGATVVVADRDTERGRSTAAGNGGEFVEIDVTDDASVAAAVDRAARIGPPLRAVVNVAGISWAQRTLGLDGTGHDTDAWSRVCDVNLTGAFRVMRRAAAAISAVEPLTGGERGVVVNTASTAAYEGQAGQLAYAASKAGIVGMTLPAARDLAPWGIRVCTIAPGLFDTPMFRQVPEPYREQLGRQMVHPRRPGDPADFGRLVRAVCENGHLNGEVIRLDGALRMPP